MRLNAFDLEVRRLGKKLLTTT